MNILFCLFFVSSITNAEHDHATHLDKLGILSLMTRSAHFDYKTILHVLGVELKEIHRLSLQYDLAEVQDKPEKRDLKLQKWNERYAEAFKTHSDNALIYSHICKDLYDGSKCDIPDDVWNAKYDSRGE